MLKWISDFTSLHVFVSSGIFVVNRLVFCLLVVVAGGVAIISIATTMALPKAIYVYVYIYMCIHISNICITYLVKTCAYIHTLIICILICVYYI